MSPDLLHRLPCWTRAESTQNRETTIAPLAGSGRDTCGEMSIRPGGVPRHALGLPGSAAMVADGGPILPFARQLLMYMRLARLLKH